MTRLWCHIGVKLSMISSAGKWDVINLVWKIINSFILYSFGIFIFEINTS